MCTDNTIVRVDDRNFRHYITHDRIQQSLADIAGQINIEYLDKNPLFLVVLNGAFMFASDLLKQIHIQCEVSFIRVSSYHGMESSQTISEVLGLEDNVINRDIIIVEDIIDTGITMEHLLNTVTENGVKSVKIATLLFKEGKFQKDYPIDFIGFSIPNDFVVGYGLDYNGYGRNLKDIYSVVED